MKLAKTLAMSGFLLAGTMTAGGPEALAQGIPKCADLPNPIYLGGTTAVLPVIRRFGARLRQLGFTLLWNENSEGCGSVDELARPTGTKARLTFSQYTEVGSGPSSKIQITTCTGNLGQVPDLVINDTYYTSCVQSYGGSTGPDGKPVVVPLPANVKEFLGPVQGLVPIVSSRYLYNSEITVDELLDLYMCGGLPNILTFPDTQTIYDYNCTSSGMRELWARGLGVDNAREFPGIVGGGCYVARTAETMVISDVAPTTTPDKTIGYTSTEFYDENRDKVRALKVRGVNQNLAYLPDTDLTSTDKINIREGRYTIQGALKLVAYVDPSTGVPVNANAAKIIDWIQDNPLSAPALTLPFDLNEIYAQHGVVPQCAMRVTKDGDQPIFKRYKHPKPCHCSFEILATGKTCIPGCTACTDSSTCPTGKICSHGYCE